jgi:hypothetical protein
MAAIETLLYEIKVTASSEAAKSAISTLETQLKSIDSKASVDVKLNVDDGTISAAGEKIGKGLSDAAEKSLKNISAVAAAQSLSSFKSDLLDPFIAKARVADDAADSLAAGLAKAGLSGAALAAESKRLGQEQFRIADSFAISRTEVAGLQAKIAGFGNISGEALDQVTEFAIGASQALQIPAEAAAKLIAKSADPESEALLAKIGVQFDKNATSAEKMAAIEAKLGPVIQEVKDGAADAIGDFDRLSNSIGDALEDTALAAFEKLGPAISIASTGISGLNAVMQINNAISSLGAVKTLALAAAEGVATGATWLWNAAINANPLGLLVIAIAGAVAAFVFFGDEIAAVADAIGNIFTDIGNFLGLVSDVDAANAKAGATVRQAKRDFNEYADAIGEVDAKIGQAKDVSNRIARLGELQKATKRTAAEDRELAQLQSELGDAFPEATAGVNALTGELELNLEKLAALNAENEKFAGDNKRQLLEENIIGPMKDLLPALDAQKEKLGELRKELDRAIAGGDKDAILEARDAYNEQRDALKATEEQLKKNVKVLVENGTIGTASAESIASAMGVSRAEAEKLVPVVQKINAELALQKRNAEAVAQSAAGMSEAFNKILQSANTKVDEQVGALSEAKRQLDEVNAKLKNPIDQSQSIESLKAQKAALLAQIKELTNAAIQEDAKRDRLVRIQKESQALVEEKQQKSRFERELKAIKDHAAQSAALTKQLESQLTQVAVTEFAKGARAKAELSADENAKLIKQRIADAETQLEALKKIAVLDGEGAVLDLQIGFKTKNAAADLATLRSEVADLSLTVSKDKASLIELTPMLKASALQDIILQLTEAKAGLANQEIEIGIRPKEDSLTIIDEQIRAIQNTLAATTLELKFDPTGLPTEVIAAKLQGLSEEDRKTQEDLLKRLNELNAKRLQLTGARINEETGLEKVLADARIGVMTNEFEREKALLAQRQASELEWLRLREASGIALTERELQLKSLLEQKHQTERLNLLKKYYNQEYDIALGSANAIAKGLSGSLRSVFEEQANMTREQRADRKKSIQDEMNNLKEELAKGSISYEEFVEKNSELADKLAELNGNVWSITANQMKDAYNAGIDAARSFFDDLFQKYVIDAALTQIMEAEKTAAVAAGTAARKALNDDLIESQMAAGKASGIAGASQAAASAIASLPFPVNIAAAAAASIAFSKIISGLTSLIKFERGGLGLVGERGPEIIGPTKDFSQFATQLIMQTVKATERTLAGASSPQRGGRQRMEIGVTGRLVETGRDTIYRIEREAMSARQTEVVGAESESLRIGAFSS